MSARLHVFSAAGTFVVEGSEREIKEIVQRITTQFQAQGGAWLSNGEWTAWVSRDTPLNVDLEPDLLGVDAVPVHCVITPLGRS